MTPRRRPSRFPERALARCWRRSSAAAVQRWPRSAAHAQACCVGTGLVTPARLRMFEDYAVGVQTSFRNVMGSFASSGNYVASPAGDNEVDLEQDLLAATRFGRHVQVALKVPFVETGRHETGVSAFGGGLGDVAANLRYDFTFAGDEPWYPASRSWPALSVPTGRTVEESGDPTSATGLGSYEPNLGVAVEQVRGRMFLSLTGFVSKQTVAHRRRPSRSRSARASRECSPVATRSPTRSRWAPSSPPCAAATRRWSPAAPPSRFRSATTGASRARSRATCRSPAGAAIA